MIFISLQKLFSFRRYLSFRLDFFVWQQNGLIRKIRLILDVMTSQPGYKIHILLNISRSKGKQTMKFGQLIECHMKIIFLEKSFAQCDTETSPRSFSEKLKLSISVV